MTTVLKVNEELKGIELYFDNKPNTEIRNNLKNNGFRFSSFKKCWYAKQSEKTFQVAEAITNNKSIEQQPEAPEAPEAPATSKKKDTNKVLSLCDSTRWTDIEVNSKQETKLIAKEVRQHLKKRFPQCKFSITSDYSHINASIKQSPYNEDSIYLKAIKEYCNNLINAYNVCYDAGDPYSDVPASYNFYFFNTSIHYDYIQTEQTEQIKEDMQDFDHQLQEFEKAEEERKEREFQAWQKEQEKREVEYKKQQEEESKQIENIYNSVNLKSLANNDQYYIVDAAFANLNKNNTLDQYREEVEKGDYTSENVKVTKEIHFTNKEALTNFSNLFLNDFDFLENTGGSYTEDNRINSMTDFYNLDKEERSQVQWNLYGLAVYYNNELQFVIDTQGYNYARYVGLTDNATIEKGFTFNQSIDNEELQQLKNKADELEDISTSVISDLNIMDTWQNESWNEYKDALKEKLKQYKFKLTKSIIQQIEIESLKVSMYKVLTEVEGIQDQFRNADIKQGDKLTLFYISDWGSIITSRITIDSIDYCSYAQYDNAIKLIFTPEGKRKLHYNYFYSTLLVYKGWKELPTEVLYNVEHRNGFIVTSSKYHSCDHKQYDEILNHFKKQDIKPIVNTYKPVLL